MELDVINLDTFIVALLNSLLCVFRHYKAVVYTEFALWHASELSFYCNLAIYVGFKDGSFIRQEHIHTLDNVNVYFIFAIN